MSTFLIPFCFSSRNHWIVPYTAVSRSPLTSVTTCQATYSDKKRLLQERVFERRQNKVALVDRPIEAGIMQVHRRISRGEPLKTRASTACGSRYFTLVAFHAGPVPGYCLTVSRENARREITSVKRATRRFHICVPSAISFSPFALSFFLSFSLFFSLTWFFSFYFV